MFIPPQQFRLYTRDNLPEGDPEVYKGGGGCSLHGTDIIRLGGIKKWLVVPPWRTGEEDHMGIHNGNEWVPKGIYGTPLISMGHWNDPIESQMLIPIVR